MLVSIDFRAGVQEQVAHRSPGDRHLIAIAQFQNVGHVLAFATGILDGSLQRIGMVMTVARRPGQLEIGSQGEYRAVSFRDECLRPLVPLHYRIIAQGELNL